MMKALGSFLGCSWRHSKNYIFPLKIQPTKIKMCSRTVQLLVEGDHPLAVGTSEVGVRGILRLPRQQIPEEEGPEG